MAFGAALAPRLRRGDCVLLRGDLGAGKTALARGIVRARAGEAIDVPSPSFSFVEVYEMDTPVHHVDLYRLDHIEQAWELGLEELIEAGITLAEWPERAEALFPEDALNLTIYERAEGGRMIECSFDGGNWPERLEGLWR